MKLKKKIDSIDIFLAISVIIAVGFFIAAVFASNYHEKKELEMWNNGYCTCGGHWVYEQAVGHKYETGFLYYCDSCNNYIEVNKKY